ncbi:transcription regulator [Actinidia rufa]|uniref:Transcription regulator n=1 Tax=Actinidia rufa TaxID=165716 RepID=A0A7J0FPH8_9ERIC|nr:transcription regulator [Actinidia rufa]
MDFNCYFYRPQVPGSVDTQPAPQISSSIQLQQRHQIHLEETPKVPVSSSNYLKPLTSPSWQPSLISTSDTADIQKASTECSKLVCCLPQLIFRVHLKQLPQQVLLGSDLIKSSSEERSLLKILGSWLGKSTIGRNRVLRGHLLITFLGPSFVLTGLREGLYEFSNPIHLQVKHVHPPNPWTMGILGLLAEIYAMPNLKMNPKFDIEVLFKNLGVDLKDVNSYFPSQGQVELLLEVAKASHAGGHSHILPQYAAPLQLSSGTLMEDEKLAALGLSDQLPPAQGLFQWQSSLAGGCLQLPTPATSYCQPKASCAWLAPTVVPIAMDRAIKEIVPGIVQHNVSLATQTTKELDYAMELDETTRIHNAARLMVASLAHNGYVITATNPYVAQSQVSSGIQLQGLNIANELLEQAVQLTAQSTPDVYSSGLGNTGIHHQPLDIVSKDWNLVQLNFIEHDKKHDVNKKLMKTAFGHWGHWSALETLVTSDAKDADIQGIIVEFPGIILRCISRDEAALAVAQKVIYSDEDRKFNKEITIGLIRSEILNLAEVISELHHLVDALAKLAARPDSPESLQQLAEVARNPASNPEFLLGRRITLDDKLQRKSWYRPQVTLQ